MNILESLFSAINRDHAISLIPKLLPHLGSVVDFAKSKGLTDDDIAGLFRSGPAPDKVSPSPSPVQAQAAPVQNQVQSLPITGFMRDHTGKDYSIQEIQALFAQAETQVKAQTQQSPDKPTALFNPERPLSCLGCRDALPGSDQPGFGKACGDKNCKGNPTRPNYSKL